MQCVVSRLGFCSPGLGGYDECTDICWFFFQLELLTGLHLRVSTNEKRMMTKLYLLHLEIECPEFMERLKRCDFGVNRCKF